MAGLDPQYERVVLDGILGDGHLAGIPGTLYVALFKPDGTELSGGGYARVSVANTTANWPAAATVIATTKSNAAVNTFPLPTTAWQATSFALMSASTGGNTVMSGLLGSALSVQAGGAAPSFAVGALVVSLD